MTTRELLGFAPPWVRALIGVNRTTWLRWRSGRSRVPAAVLVAVRMLVEGELLQGGEAWAGWHFASGRLWDPAGAGHTPATITAWHWVAGELAALRAHENRHELAGANVRTIASTPARRITRELRRRI